MLILKRHLKVWMSVVWACLYIAQPPLKKHFFHRVNGRRKVCWCRLWKEATITIEPHPTMSTVCISPAFFLPSPPMQYANFLCLTYPKLLSEADGQCGSSCSCHWGNMPFTVLAKFLSTRVRSLLSPKLETCHHTHLKICFFNVFSGCFYHKPLPVILVEFQVESWALP